MGLDFDHPQVTGPPSGTVLYWYDIYDIIVLDIMINITTGLTCQFWNLAETQKNFMQKIEKCKSYYEFSKAH